MADSTKEVAGTATVAPTEIVKVSGVGSDIWSDVDASFVPVLKKDMPIEQRKSAVRDTIKKTLQVDDRLGIMQGELLFEVSKNGYWKEWTFTDKETSEIRNYKSFDEYVEQELDWKPRKSKYLIAIYEKFVVELGIPIETLREVEWSKAKELVKVIDQDNWQDLLEKIKDMSVVQVIEFARDLAGKEKTPGTRAEKDPSATVKKSFVLHPDQAENVENALKVAKAMTGSDKDGNNLDMICTEFVASAAGTGLEGTLAKLDLIISNIQRAFGVKLEVKEVDTDRLKAVEEKAAKKAVAAKA